MPSSGIFVQQSCYSLGAVQYMNWYISHTAAAIDTNPESRVMLPKNPVTYQPQEKNLQCLLKHWLFIERLHVALICVTCNLQCSADTPTQTLTEQSNSHTSFVCNTVTHSLRSFEKLNTEGCYWHHTVVYVSWNSKVSRYTFCGSLVQRLSIWTCQVSELSIRTPKYLQEREEVLHIHTGFDLETTPGPETSILISMEEITKWKGNLRI